MTKGIFKFAAMAVMAILIIWASQLSSYALTTNVRVGFCAHMPPYQYVDNINDPEGFHIEIFEEVAKNLDLKVEYISFNTTSEAMESMEKGDIDMVLGVAKNTVSDYDVLYSRPLSTTNLCLVVNKNIADRYRENTRINESIASEFGIMDYKYLSNIGNGVTILTANQKSGIELLLSERTDLLVGVRECVSWYLKEEKRSDDYEIINNYLSSAQFCVALREGDQYLQHSIDEVLSDIRTSDLYDSLYRKWFDIYTVDYRYLFRIAMVAIAGVLSTIAVYVIISNKRKTARIEAENRLRYSIIESSPAAMVLVDYNHVIEYMNRNAMKIAGIKGYNPGASLKNMRIFREVIEKAGGDIFNSEWETKTGNIDYDKRRGRNGGEKYRYTVQKMLSYDNQAKALMTVEDITSEDREREAAFEKEKNETLNSIIAGIAHEIKNPLTTINASASMMEKKGDNEKFREAFAAYVPQEIERITRLIDSLLDYARPSVSKIEKVNLAEITESIYELIRITAKNIDVTREINDKDKLYFLGDKDKIKQALLNLMINSVEAIKNKKTEEKTRHYIKIEVSAENSSISIKVRDDGVGMTRQELERCTMPFYTTKPAGTGIGLAFIKQYVEEAGGTLIIDSVKMQFTCVEIRLPAC